MITIDGKTYRTLPEQVEENAKNIANLETADSNIQGSISELRNEVNFTAQQVIETQEAVDNVNERVTAVEDSLAQGLSNVGAEIELVDQKVSNHIASSAQSFMDIDLTIDGIESDIIRIDTKADNLEDDVNDIKAKKWYEHNIIIVYRTANERVSSANSDGTFVATLTLINQDPTAYTFAHNQDYSLIGPRVMELQPAWQLLRLYRAVQLSNQRDLNLSRACSGALVTVDTTSPYTANYCINNSISTKYYDYTDTDWKRLLVVHGTQVGVGNVGSRAIEVSVGHPTFIGGVESSMWTTRDEFAAGEYNLTDSFGNSYSTYFSQQRIRCDDTVRELIGFDSN